MQIDEPAADLAIATAIASSWKDIPVKADAVLIGEIGLAGELRMPGQMVARLREAQKLGFKTAIVPKAVRKSGTVSGWDRDHRGALDPTGVGCGICCIQRNSEGKKSGVMLRFRPARKYRVYL